jgi:membrane fusion protein, multidrug efflux system
VSASEKSVLEAAGAAPSPRRLSTGVTFAIGGGTLLLLAIGAFFFLRARARVNTAALASDPKPVTVVEARAGTYRAERQYVATLEPWVLADVGPQLIAAYADTVLVRPGAEVTRGQVLATLDCRDANATNRAVAAQARAIDAKQKALANEAARVNSLLDGGFVAPNEAEQKLAGSESELAQLLATQAKLAGTSLAVNDCVLRAPFDGEVARRVVDPGAFVRPGSAIVSVVDRSTIRATAEVPESDFAIVAPQTPVQIKMLATGAQTSGTIARRSPAASSSTRTLHFEIDLPDPERKIPVGTTAELTIQVGKPEPATIVPLLAASVRGEKATLFVVEGNHVKKVVVPVRGEATGTLYLEPSLPAGAHIVTEGRSLLVDGDKVVAKLEGSNQAPRATAGAKP